MTADSKMPDKYYWDAGNAHAHMALSGVYVEWLESRLARTEAALTVASEALWEHGHDRKGNHIGTHAGKCSLCDLYDKIAALEGKP